MNQQQHDWNKTHIRIQILEDEVKLSIATTTTNNNIAQKLAFLFSSPGHVM